MNKVNSSDLKPCPFCGGHRLEIMKDTDDKVYYYVLCGDCGVRTHSWSTIDLITDIWNKRVDDSKLEKILSWCNAYPLDVFPEPDMKLAREALEKAGLTLDAVSASNMRHVLNGIRKLIEEGE